MKKNTLQDKFKNENQIRAAEKIPDHVSRYLDDAEEYRAKINKNSRLGDKINFTHQAALAYKKAIEALEPFVTKQENLITQLNDIKIIVIDCYEYMAGLQANDKVLKNLDSKDKIFKMGLALRDYYLAISLIFKNKKSLAETTDDQTKVLTTAKEILKKYEILLTNPDFSRHADYETYKLYFEEAINYVEMYEHAASTAVVSTPAEENNDVIAISTSITDEANAENQFDEFKPFIVNDDEIIDSETTSYSIASPSNSITAVTQDIEVTSNETNNSSLISEKENPGVELGTKHVSKRKFIDLNTIPSDEEDDELQVATTHSLGANELNIDDDVIIISDEADNQQKDTSKVPELSTDRTPISQALSIQTVPTMTSSPSNEITHDATQYFYQYAIFNFLNLMNDKYAFTRSPIRSFTSGFITKLRNAVNEIHSVFFVDIKQINNGRNGINRLYTFLKNHTKLSEINNLNILKQFLAILIKINSTSKQIKSPEILLTLEAIKRVADRLYIESIRFRSLNNTNVTFRSSRQTVNRTQNVDPILEAQQRAHAHIKGKYGLPK